MVIGMASPADGVQQQPEPAIVLYQHCNYSGHRTVLAPGRYSRRALLRAGMRDDQGVGSIRCLDGATARLWSTDGFLGRFLDVMRDDACLVGDDYEHAVSSVEVLLR